LELSINVIDRFPVATFVVAYGILIDACVLICSVFMVIAGGVASIAKNSDFLHISSIPFCIVLSVIPDKSGGTRNTNV